MILVHGGWHGAWCWNKVLPLLEAQKISALAPDMPGQGQDKTHPESVTLFDYVGKIVQLAQAQNGKVILVGHSSGGTAIAQAGEQLGLDKVAALVFLDAFMPQHGESVFTLAEKFAPSINGQKAPAPLTTAMILSDDRKIVSLNPDRVEELLYHDCSQEDVAYAKAHLGPQPTAALGIPVSVTEAVYGAIPKYYLLCTAAKDFDKSELAKNVPCEKIYTLAASHSPFFSMPERLVEILTEIAR